MDSVYVLDENEQVYTKDFIINKIKNLLFDIENLKGRENKPKKAEYAVEIFNFLSKYQVITNFINHQKKFKETTINKAYELMNEKDFPEVVDACSRYLIKLGYSIDRVE